MGLRGLLGQRPGHDLHEVDGFVGRDRLSAGRRPGVDLAFRLLRRQRLDSHAEYIMTMKWTESAACRSRQHCDMCLADAAWRQLQMELTDASGEPAWTGFPELGTCPYGETLKAAKARRSDLLVARVESGAITPEAALAAAEQLGLELDANS